MTKGRAQTATEPSEHGLRVADRRAVAAVSRLACFALFLVLPLALLLYVERKIFIGSSGFGDLRVLLKAGHDVADGRDPYPSPAAVVAHSYDYFVYPAPVALAMVPLAVLPFSVAAVIFSIAMVACVVVALWVLNVRDWRCYGAVFLWFPMVLAILVGNITPLLILLLAALWRFRDRRFAAATVLACVIVAKLFLWPLLFWLLATRRYFAAFGAAITAALLGLVAWAAIGFAGLRDYGHLLSRLAHVEESDSFSLAALGESIGLSQTAAQGLAVVVGGLLVIAAIVVGARRGDDRSSFVIALVAGLLLTPIAWLHFFALLVVPVALVRRRLSVLWLVPVSLWVLKTGESHTSFGSAWRIALPLVVTATILVAATGGPTQLFAPRRARGLDAARMRA